MFVTLEVSQLFIVLLPPLLNTEAPLKMAVANIVPIFVTLEVSQLPMF